MSGATVATLRIRIAVNNAIRLIGSVPRLALDTKSASIVGLCIRKTNPKLSQHNQRKHGSLSCVLEIIAYPFNAFACPPITD